MEEIEWNDRMSMVALLVGRERDGLMAVLLVGRELNGWMVALLGGEQLRFWLNSYASGWERARETALNY